MDCRAKNGTNSNKLIYNNINLLCLQKGWLLPINEGSGKLHGKCGGWGLFWQGVPAILQKGLSAKKQRIANVVWSAKDTYEMSDIHGTPNKDNDFFLR